MKPIITAVLASPYSLNPVPSPQNPLELHINLPPPTAESRKQTLDAATEAGQAASNDVRSARSIQQKRLRTMQLAKKVRPDDLKRAHDKMEKVVEKGLAEVKKIVDGAKKSLEG